MTKPFKQRHRSRVLAMQALYQWHMAGESPDEIVMQFLSHNDSNKFEVTFFADLFKGCLSSLEQIDGHLTAVSDRNIMDFNPVELCVLRVMCFEMLHALEVPYRVLISEGVAIAANFGAEQGHTLVNRLLESLAAQLRPGEYGQG